MVEPSSRRSFLRHASAGAAVVGAASVAPSLLGGSAASAATAAPGGPVHSGVVTAYVRDYRSGEIAVMAGETEVIRYDPRLARQLANIAAQASHA